MALLPDISKDTSSNNVNNTTITKTDTSSNTVQQHATAHNTTTTTTTNHTNNNVNINSKLNTGANNNNNNNSNVPMATNNSIVHSAPLPPTTTITTDFNFPSLIFNDKNRSTAYYRQARIVSSKENPSTLIQSPLATNYNYNWSPSYREKNSVVKSKSRVYKPVSRIFEPARPPFPYKVNTSFESIEQHFHNEKRTLEMKRLQYLREHTEWSIYPYARIAEREFYNKQIRETLKEQMDQKLRTNKADFVQQCHDSKLILSKDKDDVTKDKIKHTERLKYLHQYSVHNKQLMEDRWMSDYFLKRDDWMKERNLLNQDPINWSKTLK